MIIVNFRINMRNVNFRIKKHDKGYTVEVLKKTWYCKEYWANCIYYEGAVEPYYFSDVISAAKQAGNLLQVQLLKSALKDKL